MNVSRLYESLMEVPISLTEEQRTLLDGIMSLNSPMYFDENFATDEELDELESVLDQMEITAPNCINLKNIIAGISAKPSSGTDFI